MKPTKQKLYGLISLMTLIWGLNYVAAKLVLESFPALLVGPLRVVTAAGLLAPIYWWSRRGEGDEWSRKELWILAVLGVCGITLNQLLFVMGMNRTSVAHAALVISTTPLQVMLLAALRGQERLTWRKSMGIFTAIAGIAVLNLAPAKGARGASLGGDLLVLAASMTFSLYTVFSKEITRRHDSLTVNTFGYFAGAVAAAPVLIQQSIGFDYGRVSMASWAALAYMTALSSVVCYLIFYYALNHLPATRVAAFSYVQPVIAASAGLLILHEPVTLPVAAGGLLVLSGVWLTGRG